MRFTAPQLSTRALGGLRGSRKALNSYCAIQGIVARKNCLFPVRPLVGGQYRPGRDNGASIPRTLALPCLLVRTNPINPAERPRGYRLATKANDIRGDPRELGDVLL